MINMTKAHRMARTTMKYTTGETTYREALTYAMRYLWEVVKSAGNSVRQEMKRLTPAQKKEALYTYSRYQGYNMEHAEGYAAYWIDKGQSVQLERAIMHRSKQALASL